MDLAKSGATTSAHARLLHLKMMLGFSEKLLPPRDIGLVGCPDLGSLNKYIIMFLGFYTIARIRFRSYRHLQKGTAETTHIYKRIRQKGI